MFIVYQRGGVGWCCIVIGVSVLPQFGTNYPQYCHHDAGMDKHQPPTPPHQPPPSQGRRMEGKCSPISEWKGDQRQHGSSAVDIYFWCGCQDKLPPIGLSDDLMLSRESELSARARERERTEAKNVINSVAWPDWSHWLVKTGGPMIADYNSEVAQLWWNETSEGTSGLTLSVGWKSDI